jgi:hypothetical protein
MGREGGLQGSHQSIPNALLYLTLINSFRQIFRMYFTFLALFMLSRIGGFHQATILGYGVLGGNCVTTLQ